MQRLEVSGAVRHLYGSLGANGLIGTTEYLTLYAGCRINRCRYNRVRLYFFYSFFFELSFAFRGSSFVQAL
jgi:hypothetical protein